MKYLILSIFALAGALLGAPQAQAISIYDDIVYVTDELILKDSYYCSEEYDLSVRWSEAILSDNFDGFDPWANTRGNQAMIDDIRSKYLESLDVGSWAVSQKLIPNNDNATQITVQFTPEDVSAVFAGDQPNINRGLYVGSSGSAKNQYLLTYSMNSNCQFTIGVTTYNESNGYQITGEEWPNNKIYVYLSTYPITYPPGYEGELIPETEPGSFNPTFDHETDGLKLKVTPTISGQDLADNNIVQCFFQIPNNTFGDNFTEYEYNCGDEIDILHTFDHDGSYNVVHKVLTDDGTWFDESKVIEIDGASTVFVPAFEYVVDDKHVTLTSLTGMDKIQQYSINLCLFQVPNNTYGDSFAEYQFDCDTPSIAVEHTFTEYATYNVIMRMQGADGTWYETTRALKVDGRKYTGTAGLETQIDLMAGCIVDGFPFVDIPKCISNLQKVFTMLMTGTVKFPTFEFNPGCKTLGTMGEWLNLSNRTVCPSVPAAVRNVVTPFVAFMLGLVTFKILNRRAIGNY